jgi:hypothetical protein
MIASTFFIEIHSLCGQRRAWREPEHNPCQGQAAMAKKAGRVYAHLLGINSDAHA